MKRDLNNPPMSDAMQHVMANLMALTSQLSELESELSRAVPDARMVSAHAAEIRRQFAVAPGRHANAESAA